MFYGKSYGASIAAQYAERYNNVDGLILVAPMTHFAQAATRVSRATNPIIRTLISEKWLEQEIEQTLHDSAVSSELISTPNVLKRIPGDSLPSTLVLFSEEDKISQPDDIAALKGMGKITLVSLPKRRHIEMMFFDDTVDQHLYAWLEKFEP
ncbi:MAG: alpha/beta hydrolase [Pseudomonadota bacterium]